MPLFPFPKEEILSNENEQEVTQQVATHPHPWPIKLFGSINVLLALVCLSLVGVGGFFGYKMYQRQTEFQATQEIVLSNMRVINEQTVIREILQEKMGKKLGTDQITRIAFEIQDGCRRYGIRPELVLGLMEQESTFDPFSVNSQSGATGLMQLMYDTAIKYYKARGLTLTPEALADPILNVAIGIEVLADKHEAALIQGKTTKDDYMFALFYYCGKGDTYAREVITRSVAYKKRLDTPLQEMLKKRLQMDADAVAAKEVAEAKSTKKK